MLDVTEASKVRFSAARVMARQDLFQLGRGFEQNFTRDTNPGPNLDKFRFTNGSTGNAELDPYRASQFDLSYEYYFGGQGLVAVTPFWKEVDSFITVETQSIFVMDEAGGREGPVQVPINGEGGNIKGIELSGQYAFTGAWALTVKYSTRTPNRVRQRRRRRLPIRGPERLNAPSTIRTRVRSALVLRLAQSRSTNCGFALHLPRWSHPVNPPGVRVWNRDYTIDARSRTNSHRSV